ncbi:hypothetical protein CLU79DRAFT_252360 [Phycomyces nitens]|nr:hypothetical protein CLU79DRAFT_252360 [Phycomyces nitens]
MNSSNQKHVTDLLGQEGKSKSKKKSAPKTIPSSQGNPVGTIENSLDASTDDYEKTDNSREGSVSPIDPPKDRNKPTLNTTVPEEQDQPESSQTNQSQTTHSTDQQDTTPTETQDAIDTHPKNAQEPATDSSAQFTTTGIVEPPATPTKDDPSVENLATKEPLNTIEIEIPLGTNVDQSPVESLNESKTPADVLDRSKERKDSRQSDSQQFEIVEIHSEDGDEVASNESTHNQSGLYASSILENSTYSFIDTELEPEENIGDKSGHTDAIHASENMEIPSNVIKKESKNTSDVEVGGSDKEHDQLPEQTEEIQNITKDTAPSLESNKPNAPEAGSNTVTNALSFAEAVQFSNSEKGTMSDKVLDGAHDSSETKETPGDIVSGNLESTDKAHKDTVSQPHQTEATVDITDNTKNTSAEPIVPTTHAKDSKPETFAEVVASSSSSIPDTDQQHKDVAPKEPLEEPTTNSAPTDDPKETFAKVVASSNTPAEESHKEITPEQADKNDDIPTENTKPETFAKIAESSITNIEESHKENVPVVVLVAQPKDIIADDTPADKHTPEKTADKSIVSEKSLDNSIEASECSLNSSEIDGFSIVRSKNPESNEAEQYQQPKDTKNTAPVADDDDDDSFVKVKSTKHSFTKDNATPTGSVEATNWLSNHPRTEEENVAVDNNPFGVLKSESPEMTQSPDHGKDEQEKEDIHDKDISTHQFIGKDLEHTDDSIVAQEVDSEPIKENDVQKTDVQETEPTKVSQKEEKKEIEPHSEPKSEKPSIPTHGESSLPVTTKGTSQPDDTEKAVDPTPIDQLSSKPVSTEQTPAEQDVVDQATEESTVEKDLLTIEKSTVLKDQSDSNEESTKEEESLSDGGIPKEIQSSTSDEASEQAYMSDDEQTESGLDLINSCKRINLSSFQMIWKRSTETLKPGSLPMNRMHPKTSKNFSNRLMKSLKRFRIADNLIQTDLLPRLL